MDPHAWGRTLEIDLEATVRDLTPEVAHALERFAPFGVGNPRAVMLLRDVAVETRPDGSSWVTDGAARVRTRIRLNGLEAEMRYDVVASLGLIAGEPRLSVREVRPLN